jgi:hypothetical protein
MRRLVGAVGANQRRDRNVSPSGDFSLKADPYIRVKSTICPVGIAPRVRSRSEVSAPESGTGAASAAEMILMLISSVVQCLFNKYTPPFENTAHLLFRNKLMKHFVERRR